MKKSFIFMLSMLWVLQLSAQIHMSGKIVERGSKLGLPGAHLQLLPLKKQQVSSVDGSFNFSELSAGPMQLQISFLGFEKQLLSFNLTKDTVLIISLLPVSLMQEEVVIQGSRVTADNPITYSIVDADQIRKVNNGADLPYLLQNTPSLVVTSDAGSGIGYTGLRIRGSDITRINVTLNGVPVNDPESHAVFFVNLPDLASSIENIQIQRGIGTSSNGAAAFGASINIKTNDRSQEAFSNLNSSIGSFNTFKNTLSFGTGTNSKGFSLDGRLSKISSDGFIDRGKSDLKSYFLSGVWSNKSTIVKLLATSGIEKTYQAWYGIPKESLSTNRSYNPAGEVKDIEGNVIGFYDNQTDNYTQSYYQLHLAHQLRPSMLWTATAFLTRGKGYYESWKNNDKFSKYGLENVVIGDETIKRTDLIQQKWLDNYYYGVQSSLNINHKRSRTVFGIGANHYEGDHYGLITWAKYAQNIAHNKQWYFNEGDKTDAHIFGKSTLNITNDFSLFADLQYRHISYYIKGLHDNLVDITQSHQFNFLNPKMGLHYKLNPKLGLYVSVAFSNREPNRSVYKDADQGQIIKAEKLTNYEAGARFENNFVQLESNLYFMNYTDQLVLTGKINNVGAPILTNVPSSFRAGWETMMGVKLHPKLEVNGTMSFSINKIKDFTEYVDNSDYWDDPENQPYQYQINYGTTDISFSPQIVASGNIIWKPLPDVAIGYGSQFVGRQYIDNTSTKSRSLDPYHIGSLMIQAELPNKLFKSTSLSLHLNNLFDNEYETNAWVYRYSSEGSIYQSDGYFPQAGRHWMLQLNIGF